MRLSRAEYTVWLRVLALHSLLCSLEIDRSCDSSSRMSWLDSGRPSGLPLCARATSDNLSSSVSDDRRPAAQPQSRAALRHDVEVQRSGLIQTAACCYDARPQKPFLYLLFLHFLTQTGGGDWGVQEGCREQRWALCIENVDSLRLCVCVSTDREEEEGGWGGRVRICRHRHRWNSLPPLAQTWLSMSDLL